MIHEYKTGRAICGFVEFVSWILLIIAVLGFLISMGTLTSSRGFSAYFVPLALVAIIILLLALLVVQMSRAAMDGSVAAQKMVVESRKHHMELVSAVRMNSWPATSVTGQPSYGSREQKRPPTPEPENQAAPVAQANGPSAPYQTHHGFRIYPEGMGVRVGDRKFRSLDGAQGYIDELRDLEQKMAQNGIGQLPYRNTTIVFTAGAFDVQGRTFTALSRAMNFLDDPLEPAEPTPPVEEPLKLHPELSADRPAQTTAPIHDALAADPQTPVTAADHDRTKQQNVDRDVPLDTSRHPTLVADRQPPPGLG